MKRQDQIKDGLRSVHPWPGPAEPWSPAEARSRPLPLRAPPRPSTPELTRLDEELYYQRRAFHDAIVAARHWRGNPSVATSKAHFENAMVCARYKRLEVTRLLKARLLRPRWVPKPTWPTLRAWPSSWENSANSSGVP